MRHLETLETLKTLDTYGVLDQRELNEIQSFGIVLEHKKTGAKVFLISNDDENKVFNIGFRTPPEDSTGVAHILEHSVLCGSEKFPLKDPFVELVKGSLNTFLNAMTYPDKTVYPVASCNQKDFQNLMNVYLDAVLHPNIYKEKKIFMQEGWHYELESPEGELTYNGVVYNEMKGAFSSPESVLDRYTRNQLFPDTCYGNESGGDPAEIPSLTYEQFLEFHSRYYHPSNSYIYLYGDMDMAQKLTWLDQEYLSHYDRKEIDSEIPLQKGFSERKESEIFYSITEGETEEDGTYLSLNTVVGEGLDATLCLAFQILEYTLLDAPGAPLKQALVDAGIGDDIFGGYDGGILQPYFSVIAKNANKEQKGEFLAVVKGTLRKLANMGINKRSLRAGLNYFEFRYREADFGSASRGLMYGLQCFDSWLYGGDPMLFLQYQPMFDRLKQAVETGYFEQLICKYLLDNPFETLIVVSPKKNLTAQTEKEVAEKLAAYKSTLSREQIQALIQDTLDLKEYQDTPSSKEDLEKIPLLTRADIGTEAEKLICEERSVEGIPVLHHNLFTAGIGYLTVLFHANRVPAEDLPYVGLLKTVLGYVNTEHYTYNDLTSEIHLNSGGLNLSVTSYPNLKEKENFDGVFVANIRVLFDKLDFGFQIIEEILNHSILDDEKRLGEILSETKSRSRSKLEDSGHGASVSRATSYFSGTAYFNDVTGGIGFYHFLEKTAKEFGGRKQEIMDKLKSTAAAIFTADNMIVSYTADETGFQNLPGALKDFKSKFPVSQGKRFSYYQPSENKNEGFKTSSQVNYVARCGSFSGSGFQYTGALKILKVILNYEYMWLNIRVKGGAYGCMSGFGLSGEGYFVSYRDPNLAESNRIYEGIPKYLEEFKVDERDMTKYVIGAISELDTPLTPSIRGARGLSSWMSGVTDEMLQKERDQVLSAQVEDIRNLAGIIRAVLSTGSLCVIGNDQKVSANKELFGEIKNLFNS